MYNYTITYLIFVACLTQQMKNKEIKQQGAYNGMMIYKIEDEVDNKKRNKCFHVFLKLESQCYGVRK